MVESVLLEPQWRISPDRALSSREIAVVVGGAGGLIATTAHSRQAARQGRQAGRGRYAVWMRATRALGVLLTAVMVTITLSGCIFNREMETKTLSIAGQIEKMPGILEIEPTFREISLGQPRQSSIWLTLAAEVTEAEVLDILTAFSAANVASGIQPLSTKLTLRPEAEDVSDWELLRLDLAEPSAQQLSDLARTWFELRTRYANTDVALIRSNYRQHPWGFEVSIRMPEGSTVMAELAAIRDVSGLFADIGPVTKLFAVKGGFTVERSLPSESTLALAESIAATEGLSKLSGTFFGEEMFDLDARMSEESGLVDFAIGVSPVMARVVDLVPSGTVPVRFSFRLGDARERTAFFYNESCERYRELPASDQSRALLLYWARDGRTLLDGSTAASCFA